MPLYEYRCEDCGGLFERLVRYADEPVSCTHCKSERVKKQFSVFAARVAEGRGGREEMASESCDTCSSTGQGMCGLDPH